MSFEPVSIEQSWLSDADTLDVQIHTAFEFKESTSIDDARSWTANAANMIDVRALSIQITPTIPKTIGFTFPEGSNWIVKSSEENKKETSTSPSRPPASEQEVASKNPNETDTATPPRKFTRMRPREIW